MAASFKMRSLFAPSPSGPRLRWMAMLNDIKGDQLLAGAPAMIAS